MKGGYVLQSLLMLVCEDLLSLSDLLHLLHLDLALLETFLNFKFVQVFNS